MKTVSYTQVWGMADWMEHNSLEVGRAFMSVEAINWLRLQGYRSQVTRHFEVASDNFHITMSFEIPEEVYTFMLLKWPEEVVRIDFDGPTIRETRS